MKWIRACTGMFMGLCALLIAGGTGWAGVSPEEAAKLKTTLTPMGAERAGNKEGTIPEWTGGTKQKPYAKGQRRTNGFEDEKPLFSITAKNMDQYADKLSEGIKAWLKKWPDYRLDVYPTHRTASLPEHVYEAMYQNALRAKMVADGNVPEGVAGGIGFPIPKTGKEALWNHIARCETEASNEKNEDYTITAGGKKIMVALKDGTIDSPVCYKGMTPEKLKKEAGNAYWTAFYMNLGPPDKAGEINTGNQTFDSAIRDKQSWQYLVGQRRVRRTPNVAYDTPNPVNSGAQLVDEVWGFGGATDRFDMKIIGKQEMYIPYNNEKAYYAGMNLIKDHFLNPDYVRWELHRVWVVEANLAPGKRNMIPRRRFYLDEDTWFCALNDQWDGQGKLWKGQWALPYMFTEIPAMQYGMFGNYDIQKGSWFISGLTVPEHGGVHKEPTPRHPLTTYTPAEITRRGIR